MNSNDYNSLPQLVFSVCSKYWDKKIAFKYKVNGNLKELAYSELWEQIENFALGLLSLGFKPNDRIAIVSENRIEWFIVDVAIASIGAITVPIFPSTTPKQEEYIFNDCSAVGIVISNNLQLKKIQEVKDRIPSLRHFIILDDIEIKENLDLSIKTFQEISSIGYSSRQKEKRDLIIREKIDKIKPEDILTIIYTSGTTGDPKGVVLTHNNILSNVISSAKSIQIGEDDIFLSYLPWCHAYEHTVIYAAFSCGALIGIAESIETISTNIKEIKPTLMTTVPRLLEIIKKKVSSQVAKEGKIKQKIFNWAFEIGKKYVQQINAGEKPSILLSNKYQLADKLVFSKIRSKLGIENIKFISGGAPLNVEVNLFFWALGYKVYEGYGLTEASPVVSVTREDDVEFGTVGKPLENVEVKIAEDGEILVRGPNVMRGYWNDLDATKTAIDEENWLYTGDVGYITARGNLKITDRKKYIFVNSGGKNISPQLIENVLNQSQYVDQCIIIGDNREYNTALILPNFEELKKLAEVLEIKYTHISELVSNEKIIKIIKNDIDRLQKDLSKFERVRKFALLTEAFTVDSGELSPKMSVKRHVVERKYSDLIEQLYKLDEFK
ncbi:MAG: long-chain fatty acid--CoA ligase [Ignavibacteria bacterium]|nr:long-chain fatty acid--CoA ligase [Ignavibacteria bacterium]